MSEDPLVTVVIPARNEEGNVEECLAHVAAQDYPLERIEVLVVDGASTDRTAELARRALPGMPFARAQVITNPKATTPSNLNRGMTEGSGEYLCRVDARSFIPSHYVRTCVDILASRPEVAVVGGAQVAIPPRPGPIGIGIARALNNRYAMGFSRYRRGAASGRSDTVYLGAFRTADLRELGGWDERLETNQDFDLNRRMRARGLVWFNSTLAVRYIPRDSLAKLFRQYHRFGRWKVRYWRQSGDPPRVRQVALILGPPLTALGLAALWARLPGRWRLAVPCITAGMVLAAESGGANESPASPGHRLASLGAFSVVAAGWSSGVWRGLLSDGLHRPG